MSAALALLPAQAHSALRIGLMTAPGQFHLPLLDSGSGEVVLADDTPLPGDQERHTVAARRGATLIDMLTDADVPHGEAAEAVGALKGVYDPRRLRTGQEVTVVFEPRRGGRRFVGLEIAPTPARSVSVARSETGGFTPAETVKAIESHPVVAEGTIRSSLFEAGQEAGVPVPVMMELIRIYSHEVDFQRDLQPGDRFAVYYESKKTGDGAVVGNGDILFASLILSGKEMPLYRYSHPDGRTDFYDRNGESVRRSLLRTPVEGARLTSGFGKRVHPILGYSRAHKGLDFGAPTGTPVFAAGRGVIEQIGRNGAYGNYVRIRHDSDTETAYGHLSRFGGGLKAGARVDQGQVIAFVGATGLATGPHLHYEVLRRGQQVDPRSVDLPTGEKLDGKTLDAFKSAVAAIDAAFQKTRTGNVSLVSAPDRIYGPSRMCTGPNGC